MGTILEGTYDAVRQVVADCFYELERDCKRISLQLKMDFRAGTESRLNSKTDRLQHLLGRSLNT